MSISTTINNALTGLSVAARSASVVSNNIANAQTPGYGRQVVDQSAKSLAGAGAGVTINSITREVDPVLLDSRRSADTGQAYAETKAGFLQRVEDAIGLPGEESSLTAQIDRLEASLLAATSRPDAQARLDDVVSEAKSLTLKFDQISDSIQGMRGEADRAIGREVDNLNTLLGQIQELNIEIRNYETAGSNSNPLKDQRQTLIDDLAQVLPINVVQRDYGVVSIFTPTGTALIDSSVATIDFTTVNVVVPQMTLASGGLFGLEINGRPAATSGSRPAFTGGRLGALFEARDEILTNAQTQLDAVARDMVERFADPAVDTTLLAGDPGLFTDAGAAFLPADEVGLSGRLSVNANVDPDQGGLTWRIRDGLNAVATGPAGDATLLNAMAGALTAARVPASGSLTMAARSASGLADDFLSSMAMQRRSADVNLSFSSARADALRERELGEGVDTDQELQNLLLIEQAYAANARVIQTADQMLDDLLRMLT